MAKKKVTKIIQEKLNYKKPLKQCDRAVDDIVRIRNNEQAKLRRLNDKFKGTKKKGEADKLRKEIKGQERAIDDLKTAVSQIREKCKDIATAKSTSKSLKLKNAALNRKLVKMQESKVYNKEYQTLNTLHFKNSGLITDQQNKIAALTYKINKDLGFDSEVIAKGIEIPGKVLEKEFSEDFEEEFLDDLLHTGGRKVKQGVEGREYTDEEEAEEEQAEEETPEGYVMEMGDVFWEVWRNFDNVEKPRISDYDWVIFQFSGGTFRFKGTSLSLISLKSSEMWRFARENGSDTYAIKYISVDGSKLKLVIED